MGTSYVYILTNKNHTVLYIGVTSHIVKRLYAHKNRISPGFTKKYNIDKLIYCEKFYDIHDAIKREKQLKKWNRSWKIQLIEKMNPTWKDLCGEIDSFEIVD